MIFSGCISYSGSALKPVELPPSMFDLKSPENWAQIQITEYISVVKFDEYRVNWYGFKEQHLIPSGRHKIQLLPSGSSKNAKGESVTYDFFSPDGYSNNTTEGSITYNFSPGHKYILGIGQQNTTGNVRTTSFQINEHGFTEYAVPGRNQSIVELTLRGGEEMRG